MHMPPNFFTCGLNFLRTLRIFAASVLQIFSSPSWTLIKVILLFFNLAQKIWTDFQENYWIDNCHGEGERPSRFLWPAEINNIPKFHRQNLYCS